MVKLGYLFETEEKDEGLCKNIKKSFGEGIDKALAEGSAHPETLKLMKELLKDISIVSSMDDYMEQD